MRTPLPFSWWFWRILFALLIAWGCVLAGSALLYTHSLLHPACAPATAVLDGYQVISLTAPEGFRLSGWYRPPHNGMVIVLLGGHGANRDALLPEAAVLSAEGYGILALEQRACAGAQATLGYREAQDVTLAVDYAMQQPSVQRVGALGFSAGGVAVILAAAHDPRISAVVAEGNYANLLEEMLPMPGAAQPWLEAQLHPLVIVFYALATGIWPAEVSPEVDLPRISPRPVLLIHGEREIARSRGQRQFQGALPPRALWVVPGAGHGEYLKAVPAEYAQRLLIFFDGAK